MERYESYKDSGVKWLGEIPGHWEVKRFRFIFSENKKKNIDLKYNKQLQFKYGDIVPKDRQDIDAESSKTISNYTIVKEGDIMINGLNLNYDFISQRVAMVRESGIITSAYIALSYKSGVNPSFYNYFMKSMDYRKMFHGMGSGIRLTLAFDNLKNLFFPYPAYEEQTAIANYLDSITSKIDEAISQQQKMIDLLNERKQIIIQNAVTKGLDPNAKMKDSGVKWLGEIPGHWEVRRLKFVTKYIFLGKTPKYSLIENKYKIIGQKCNQLDGIKMCDCKYAEENFYHERKEYEFLLHGDVLLNSLGGGSVGRIGYYNLKEHGVLTDGHIIVIRNKPEFNSRFLYYFLSTKRKDFETMASGSTNQMFLLVSDINKQFVPLPPKSEQNAIAHYLDSVSSKIDSSISQCNKMISLLQERKQIIINDVVTGKVKVI